VLVDTRQAESLLSVTEIYQLGKELASHSILRQSKICVLVPPRDVDKADFFETVAVNRGVQIKAFTNFEQAITWFVDLNES
jgi:hypothetical protein